LETVPSARSRGTGQRNPLSPDKDDPPIPEEVGAVLRRRFPNLRRHFVFEYYPWYAANPYRQWDQWDRQPPTDIAASAMPLLGAYDSRSIAVLERHAEWIRSTGVGSVNLSWWGPESFSDTVIPAVMDVMSAHDIRVTFHLEPYRPDRANHFVQDILYLLRRYGERRRWDCLLLLDYADGRSGPVFKTFGTIVPPEIVDCHGVRQPVEGYTPDRRWRYETDLLRHVLRDDFRHVTLLADSLDLARTDASGFDGIAVYDNLVEPSEWPTIAAAFSRRNLLFSFNCNPGYDAVRLREVPPESCYAPAPFVPRTGELDWADATDRERARYLAEERIDESLLTTLRLQTHPGLVNSRRGFFLTYVNSFNEWHEGHQFEPMKDWPALRPVEQALGYHNPSDGDYRLDRLRSLLSHVLTP